jgi:carbon monoxide dehydrogenase subunit G
MKLDGSYTFDAPRDIVWEALLDPDTLAKVMPGCEKLEQIGENEYKGVIKIKVGPVQGTFEGIVTLSDINPPDQYRMLVDGRGAPGFMRGEGQVTLEPQGDSTVMHYAGEAQVGGRIASVGQRLLDSSAKALTRQSLDGLNKQIQARLQAPQDTTPVSATASQAASGEATAATPQRNSVASQVAPVVQPAEVAAPSQVEFALGVAKHMAEDLLPPERRPILIGAGLGVLAIILFLNWWANLVARKVANEIWERR